MADWDADGPQLRANLERVLKDVARWADQRDRLTAAAIKRWHRHVMAGLAVPEPTFVGHFRGEPGLEGQPVYIGSRRGTRAERVAGEVRYLRDGTEAPEALAAELLSRAPAAVQMLFGG